MNQYQDWTGKKHIVNSVYDVMQAIAAPMTIRPSFPDEDMWRTRKYNILVFPKEFGISFLSFLNNGTYSFARKPEIVIDKRLPEYVYEQPYDRFINWCDEDGNVPEWMIKLECYGARKRYFYSYVR